MDKDLKHNYIVNIIDGCFFGFGVGFASFNATIPLFMMTLTDSAVILGLIPAIHSMGWQLPQLFMAQHTSKVTRFKPLVMMLTIHERVPFFGLALIALFSQYLGKDLAIALSLMMLVWQGIGGGLAGNGWQNLLAKIIPSSYLATFFGLQSSGSSLFTSLASVLAGLMLDKFTGSTGFTLIFTLAGIFTMISWLFLNMTRENEHEVVIHHGQDVPLTQLIKRTLSNNPGFSWFLVTRWLTQFSLVGIAFYVVYATRQFDMSKPMAGLMLGIMMFTQVIANPVLGWMSDRWNRKYVMIFGLISGFFSCIIAAYAPHLNWFYLVFVLAGIANTVAWTIAIAFVMDFGYESDRPYFVGISNTIMAPATILAPVIGGWLADAINFRATFNLGAVCSLLAALILYFFVHQKIQKSTPAVDPSH